MFRLLPDKGQKTRCTKTIQVGITARLSHKIRHNSSSCDSFHFWSLSPVRYSVCKCVLHSLGNKHTMYTRTQNINTIREYACVCVWVCLCVCMRANVCEAIYIDQTTHKLHIYVYIYIYTHTSCEPKFLMSAELFLADDSHACKYSMYTHTKPFCKVCGQTLYGWPQHFL